jgi:hypothetical protein
MIKVLPKGVTQKALEKAQKRSELLQKTRANRVGLAKSLKSAPLEAYEQNLLAISRRRRKAS